VARTVGRSDYYPLRGGARFRRAGQQVQTGSHPSATQGHLQFSRELVFVELLYQFTAGRLAILSRLPAPATDFEPIGACSLLSLLCTRNALHLSVHAATLQVIRWAGARTVAPRADEPIWLTFRR
jgi:hypothetical protein